MSGKFSGFTEDDIKNVQNNSTTKRTAEPTIPDKQNVQTRSKKSQKVVIRVDKARHKILESKTATNGVETPLEAKLSQPTKPLQENKNKTNENKIEENEQTVNNERQQEQHEKQDENQHNLEKSKYADDIPEKKFLDLEEFQARQKVIEEQNKRRKELLSKALADRTKRTQEEAQRLNDIQNEFKKLDKTLSSDVRILRKQIEVASLDYMESQKRYLRIEKEFLEAKIQLQNKLERKELLTEHLCTIIEQNEERKAKKLTELINKLDLGNTEKELEEVKSPN